MQTGNRRATFVLFIAVLCGGITACGGGGGGSSTSDSNNSGDRDSNTWGEMVWDSGEWQ